MAQTLETHLKSRLKNAKKVVVLGVGSDLRADDAAGMLVAELLKPHVKVVFGATASENLTGEVRRLKPTHLIIIDAAQMGKKPGAIEIIEPGRIEGITFTTHQLPMSIIARYLNQEIGCEIILIGIQPKTLKFGDKVSPQVKASVAQLARLIKKILAG